MNGTELVWKFSPDSSPGYQESSWDDIKVVWSIQNDPTLNRVYSSEGRYLELPSKHLRQEQAYDIQVDYKGKANSFFIRQNFKFVPKTCQYLVANGTNAYSFKQTSKNETGVQDIEMLLSIKKNDQIDQKACKFYDKFQKLDYRFFLKNSEEQPQVQPQLDIQLINDTDGSLSEIKAILPADQQNIFTQTSDIEIVFQAYWTN